MFLGDLDYFQIMFWPGGGAVGMVLWTLSVVMLALITETFINIRRTTIMPLELRDQVQSFFDNKQYRVAIEATATDPTYFGFLVHSALSEAPYGYVAMQRAIDEAANERTAKMLRKAEYLNLLGNLGPMIGLLGTVWGLILTFFKIVEAGGIPDPGKLAGAIGIKLVCTLLGLVIAIPSLAVYGITRNRVDTLTGEAIADAQKLIANFRPGKKVAAE
jgi:biopolymer transport protein ExbB